MDEIVENELAARAVAGLTKAVLTAIEGVRDQMGPDEQIFFLELEEALQRFEQKMNEPVLFLN